MRRSYQAGSGRHLSGGTEHRFYPRVRVDGAGKGVVSQAGGSLLTEVVRVASLDRLLAAGLAPWRKPRAIHAPAKVITDLAIALGLGGTALLH